MMTESEWTWAEGPVDPKTEHIELRYGDAIRGSLVAMVGKPNGRVFPVRWLRATISSREVASAVRSELDFYLVWHPKAFVATGHPWSYAVYHCGTAANIYSTVHWSHFESEPARKLFRRDWSQSSGGRNMTGEQLFFTLQPGEFLRLAHEAGKVHRAFLDEKTGEMRICRPTMLQRRSRDWTKVGVSEYSTNPCDTCK